MIIIEFTRAHHLPLSWARLIQFILHLISWIFFLIYLPTLGWVFKEFPFSLPMSYQRIRPHPRPLWMVRNMATFLRWGAVRNSSNFQTGGPRIVGCQRLLIQYIRSYFHIGGRSSFRNLRTRHAMMAETHLSRFQRT